MKTRQGEIWTADMFYKDYSINKSRPVLKHKKRPVLIINNDLVVGIDNVVAKITSKKARTNLDVIIEHWEQANLDRPSIVRTDHLYTIHNFELKYKIGKLSKDDLKKVLKSIQSYISMEE
jgi:mRNA interferase MazF